MVQCRGVGKLRSTVVVFVDEPQQLRCIDQMDSSSVAEILAFSGESPARDEYASGEVLGEQPIEPASDFDPDRAMRVVLTLDYKILAVCFRQPSRIDVDAAVLAEPRHLC